MDDFEVVRAVPGDVSGVIVRHGDHDRAGGDVAVGLDAVFGPAGAAAQMRRLVSEQTVHQADERIDAEHAAFRSHDVQPFSDQFSDARVVFFFRPSGEVAAKVVVSPEKRIELPVNAVEAEVRVVEQMQDLFIDVRFFLDGHAGDDLAGIPGGSGGFDVSDDRVVDAFAAVVIREFAVAVDRDGDRVESSEICCGDFAEMRGVRVEHEVFCRQEVHIFEHPVHPEERLAAVEDDDGFGVFCDEIAQDLRLVGNLFGHVIIDGDAVIKIVEAVAAFTVAVEAFEVAVECERDEKVCHGLFSPSGIIVFQDIRRQGVRRRILPSLRCGIQVYFSCIRQLFCERFHQKTRSRLRSR